MNDNINYSRLYMAIAITYVPNIGKNISPVSASRRHLDFLHVTDYR